MLIMRFLQENGEKGGFYYKKGYVSRVPYSGKYTRILSIFFLNPCKTCALDFFERCMTVPTWLAYKYLVLVRRDIAGTCILKGCKCTWKQKYNLENRFSMDFLREFRGYNYANTCNSIPKHSDESLCIIFTNFYHMFPFYSLSACSQESTYSDTMVRSKSWRWWQSELEHFGKNKKLL